MRKPFWHRLGKLLPSVVSSVCMFLGGIVLLWILLSTIIGLIYATYGVFGIFVRSVLS